MNAINQYRWLPVGNEVRTDDGFWEKSLSLSSRSIELIATNIANADTPDFKARNLDFQGALADAVKQVDRTELAVTHGQHMTAVPQSRDPFVDLQTPVQPAIDGNTVDLDAQRAAFAEAVVRHSFTVNRAIGEYKDQADWVKALT
jgi:flagellar basal-body rod protein FlgB